mmetsp:Transcript_38162/g.63084  ORF Transcript_38162/g.63084 Transcript_38162/m.63084 type:complete len:240 (+) Transcript_38162:77-796(+)
MRFCARARVIPFVRQSFSWDCGFACIEMVLRALGVAPQKCSLQKLQQKVSAKSIWTVDLAHILCDFGVRFQFLTTSLGVNPAYEKEPFYRQTIDTDSERVKDAFLKAALRQIRVEHRSISTEQLRQLVGPEDNIIVALVDHRRLYRPPLGFVGGLVDALSQCLFGGYAGHYVLVTAYDDHKRGYYIKDPAKSSQSMLVNSDDLDAARLSHGTDEDLLVIPWSQRPRAAAQNIVNNGVES